MTELVLALGGSHTLDVIYTPTFPLNPGNREAISFNDYISKR
jgi:hypothetical protein